jgi:guanine deaminase
MVLPHPGPKNIGSLVTTTGLVPDPGGTILRPVTDFAQRTIDLARRNVAEGGRPFATVIVKDGEVLAESANKVAQTNDPTAHAEILAIREACMRLGTEHLVDTTIYVMAHPCPMCLGSLYYCSPREVIFLITRESYEQYYLDDRKYFEVSTFYNEFAKSWDQRRLPMRYEPRDSAVDVYRFWNQRNGGERKSTVVPPG